MHKIFLKKDRDKSLRRKHPWIFSGAVNKVEGNPQPGETVAVFSAKGDFLAHGAYSPKSQIRVRVWSYDEKDEINSFFFFFMLKKAIDKRRKLVPSKYTNAVRLVFSESDGLPGLIVDRYADFLVVQFLSAGADYWKKDIADALLKIWPCTGIYERSDSDVRKKEGLKPFKGRLLGKEAPQYLEISEGLAKFRVDIHNGHKTGFYLDQRDNRRFAAGRARDKHVLNAFSYTGGFAIHALYNGANSVVNVDTSADAIKSCQENLEINNLQNSKINNTKADVFTFLREAVKQNEMYDLIILDPPKFAASTREINTAARGYKDINMQAFKLLPPGGLLYTFSCSGLLSRELFSKIVADAALDAGKNVQIIQHLYQAPDHPVALNFPEGLYLKGLLCLVE